MRIKKIRIRNFGQFHNREFTFAPGLNVVYGENESGKTTPAYFFSVHVIWIGKVQRQRSEAGCVYEIRTVEQCELLQRRDGV